VGWSDGEVVALHCSWRVCSVSRLVVKEAMKQWRSICRAQDRNWTASCGIEKDNWKLKVTFLCHGHSCPKNQRFPNWAPRDFARGAAEDVKVVAFVAGLRARGVWCRDRPAPRNFIMEKTVWKFYFSNFCTHQPRHSLRLLKLRTESRNVKKRILLLPKNLCFLLCLT